jgi:hypothetical protein
MKQEPNRSWLRASQHGALTIVVLTLMAAGLAACGGSGSGDQQEPGPAASWTVSLNNPTDTCFKPDSALQLLVTAEDDSGVAVTNPDYTVSAVPADGIEPDGSGGLTVRGEGPLELTVTYTGSQSSNSTIAPQTFQLVRDGTAPTITVTSPLRGAMRQSAMDDEAVDIAGSVNDALSPVKVVVVNEDVLVKDGNTTTVPIATTQPAHWGTNIVRVRAADACGNTANHVQSFLQSTAYLAPTISQTVAARVPNASAMRIGQAGLDDNNRADFDDLVTLSQRYLQNNLTRLLNQAIARIPTESADYLNCTYSADPLAGATIATGSPTLELMLDNGKFALTFDIRNVRIPVTYRQVCRGLRGNVISDVSATFGHRIDRLTTVVTVTPHVTNRQLVTNLTSSTMVTGFSVDFSASPTLASAINAVLPFANVEGILEDLIDSNLGQIAGDLVNNGLNQLTQVLPIQFADPINKTLNVAGDWTSVGVSQSAITMELGQYIFPSAVGTPYAGSMGAIDGNLATRALVGHPGAPLTYGLNDDGVNQMLWALWYGGGLELHNLQNYAATLPDVDVDLTGATLDISGLLPPVIMRSDDPSQVVLSLGDVRVTGSVDLDKNATLPGSGVVSFDVYASLLTDGRTGFDIARNTLSLRLGDVGNQFYLQINSLDLDGSPLSSTEQARAIEKYLRGVVRSLLRQLTRNISEHVELPQYKIDFPAQYFGPQAGFILDIVSLKRDDDRFVLSVDPDDAYAPPVVNITNWDQLADAAINAAHLDAGSWLQGAEVSCSIERSAASGWAVGSNTYNVTDGVKQALIQAGAPDSVAREWNRVFKSAWLGWGDQLRIPDLPWFPAFAGDDFLSGVPHTSGATTGALGTLRSDGRDALTRAAITRELEFRLQDYLDQPGAIEAIDAFATDISGRFDTQLQTGTIDNVTGTAIYPDFAAWAATVVVVSGVYIALEQFEGVIDAVGFILDAWPPPPTHGPLIGVCRHGGRFGNNAFQ